MNKTDLINHISDKSELTKADSKKALESLVSCVGEALSKNEKVSLIGFGTFSVSKRAEREGRNPQTGAKIKIAAKNVVKFKPGSELTEKVN